jgi:hypothetical protein
MIILLKTPVQQQTKGISPIDSSGHRHHTVEPERLPRLARDQVAHPRVRNLVGDHAGQRTVAGEKRRRHKGQLRDARVDERWSV